MLRSVAGRFGSVVANTLRTNVQRNCAVVCVRQGHGGATETPEQFDERYVAYFSRKDISSWEVRKAINDINGEDVVPEPKIIIAALNACRRVNDHSLAVRMLESIKYKCGPKVTEIWPYLLGEIGSTLKELGVSTPEELGYDKPELAAVDVYDIH